MSTDPQQQQQQQQQQQSQQQQSQAGDEQYNNAGGAGGASSSSQPSGGALTKEQRIERRRQRVAARLRKKDPQYAAQRAKENRAGAAGERKAKKKIASSRDAVDSRKLEAVAKVTDVRVENDAREQMRRATETSEKHKRYEQVERELEQSAAGLQKVRDGWASVNQHEVPQQLYQDIVAQQEVCAAELARKDEHIVQLRDTLKRKDEEYVSMLAQQQEDVTRVVDHMEAEFDELLECYERELEAIEETFMKERQELLDSSRAAMDDLFEKRRQMELMIVERRQKQESEFQEELTKMRSRDAEDYNNLKVTLENNIQLLEQQLEEMRATYQLNTEKLDYNHRVLKERDAENKQTNNQAKEKVKRLKEALNAHAGRYHKQDAKYKAENNALTEEFRRATEQFKGLQNKYRQFERADRKKFREIWEMNEQNVMAVVDKVLAADKMIHEQILGLKWLPPEIPTDASHPLHPLNANATLNQQQLLQEQQGDSRGTPSPREQPDSARIMMQQGQFSNDQMRQALVLIAEEATFLVDSKLKQRLSSLPEEQQSMYMADVILSVVGVTDREDLEELIALMYDSPRDPKPTIDRSDVVKVVKSFVMQRQNVKKSASAAAAAAAAAAADGKKGAAKASALTEKRERKRQREREYWRKLSNVASVETLRVWDALEKGLQDYNSVLQQRAALVEETTHLSKQNQELKRLIQQYVSSDVNDELQIPPTRMVHSGDN
eukprot:TRINITY_DN66974_c0_g1_i1.p1 TRINITY_DN66974_c0_g1~~TRINITY_DN66974_c0_g1_i1.p1  ORF type:complete len:730 (-),score=485.00 TRINITY_DN66974_c0_g1_i1:38-2206(-)